MALFEKNLVLRTAEDVKRLAEHLSQCPEVRRFDEGQDVEAGDLADSFAEIERSLRTFLEEQLPKLAVGETSPPETFSLLLDIGEEFRRLLYHLLEHQKFYKYLVSEGTHIVE
jgi:hypothetical protein